MKTERNGNKDTLDIREAYRTETLGFNEGKLSDDKFTVAVADIADMTEYNDHAGALVAGSELLDKMGKNRKGLTDIFKSIQAIQKFEGELPSGISSYRYEKYNNLKTIAEKILTPEQFTAFHNAY